MFLDLIQDKKNVLKEYLMNRELKVVKAHGTVNCKPCVFFSPKRRNVNDPKNVLHIMSDNMSKFE